MKYLFSFRGASLLVVFSLFGSALLLAAGPPQGKKEKVNGKTLQEYAPYNLLFTVSANRFKDLLTQYEIADLSQDQIAGFTFVPERRYYTPNEVASIVGPTDGEDLAGGEEESLEELPAPPTHTAPQGPANDNRPGVYQTIGFRVFLTYWEEDTALPNKRGMRFFGLDSPADAFSLAPLNPSPEYFTLIATNPDEYNAVEDRRKLEKIIEFELSFLPYDEYLYLAEGLSFYPSDQQGDIDADQRGLIIERAAVSQSFSVATGNNMDSLFQYRTLSFRPSPEPDWGSNEESSIAFSYGYYCPPYWQENDTIGSNQNLSDNGALFFQQPTVDTAVYGDKMVLALNNIMERHLERATSTVEAFYDPPSFGSDFLDWIIGLVLLLIGVFIGNQFNKPAASTN